MAFFARSAALLSLAAAASAASRTTWQQEATIKSATAECAPYDFPAADAVSAYYPEIWATADLSHKGALASDKAIFTAMNSSIPKINPRGSRDGTWNKESLAYNTNTDPDCWWTDTLCTSPKLAGIEDDITTCPQPNTWGFTLDDGPNCSHNAYFDYLNSIEQKATLFYIGSNVLDWPLEAQRGLAEGHEICSHTWSHPYMTAMTNEEAFAELYYSKKAIHDILGITVTCWRPPYGDVDDRIRYIANQLGMKTIIWDNDTDDWNYVAVGVPKIESNYDTIIGKNYSSHGTIVLSHEIDGETMVLSEQFLPEILKKFTGGVMPVGTCQNITQPYAEGDAYVYPNYAQWAAGTRSIKVAAPTAYSKEIPFATGLAVTSSGLPAGAATSVAVSTASASAATGTATTKTKVSKSKSAALAAASASSASAAAAATSAPVAADAVSASAASASSASASANAANAAVSTTSSSASKNAKVAGAAIVAVGAFMAVWA